jgi:hypothetical protein
LVVERREGKGLRIMRRCGEVNTVESELGRRRLLFDSGRLIER